MTEWVHLKLSATIHIPLSALQNIAPGIDIKEFKEEYIEDPDEAIETLKEFLILRDAVEYAEDFEITELEM